MHHDVDALRLFGRIPWTMTDRQCAHCGKSIDLYHGKSDYCGDACRMKAYRLRKKALTRCAWCHGPFKPKRGARFCSKLCAEHARYLRIAGPKVEMTCQTCGGPINERARRGTCYCSDRCREMLRTLLRSTERAGHRFGRSCNGCGDPIPDTRRADAIYCSTECGQRHRDQHRYKRSSPA